MDTKKFVEDMDQDEYFETGAELAGEESVGRQNRELADLAAEKEARGKSPGKTVFSAKLMRAKRRCVDQF
jgi:hypothetical protein